MTQFIRELKIQKFLEHPNIIKVYGVFSDEDNIYIILELGSDGQLYDIISNSTTLSEETTSFIIGNLLDAVNLMHRYKILHRDIKPQNIVLVHVSFTLFRVISNCATLDGQLTRRNSSEALSVVLLCTCHQNLFKVPGTIKRQTSGRLAFQPTNCIMDVLLLTQSNKKTFLKSYIFIDIDN